jgi:hypothetical protein
LTFYQCIGKLLLANIEESLNMNAKAKRPRISKQIATEIAGAVQTAYSNGEADKFFEEVIEATRRYQTVFAETDQQTRTE